MDIQSVLKSICVERPVGTPANDKIIAFLENWFTEQGYEHRALPFACMVWEHGDSYIDVGDRKLAILPSPYSKAFSGTDPMLAVDSVEAIKAADCAGKILVLTGKLTESPLQPKDYPFYYPDEHRDIIQALESSGAVAILCVTGMHPTYEMEPFYIFEDGDFEIPSAYVSQVVWSKAGIDVATARAKMHIDSTNRKRESRQLVARKKTDNSKGKIIMCAHMDSKYGTPGALDNAAGLTMMLRVMDLLKARKLRYDILCTR